MTDTSELDKLIVENLLDLDQAAKRVDALGDQIWKQIYETFENWAMGRGWRGSSDEDDPWVAPKNWVADKEREAWFYPDNGPDDTGEGVGQEPYHALSRYVGVAGGQLCLWFGQKTGARKWKPLAREHAQIMVTHGFHLSDAGNFYTVCSLDARTVAAALADQQLETAMAPIEAALQRAANAEAEFTKLLAKVKLI
ncbi:hypothetical protein [Kaistia terrae]|uniref:Uncharacterized protein n=1 Tax=Kaistia terrae TaxID=537017 RepID=A0ABW0Q007_9HYPH|nr:hypothetical protein [Kaistia terrae]MCX5580792.1 hypothetical protein [Kaistia terrae]